MANDIPTKAKHINPGQDQASERKLEKKKHRCET